MELDSTHQRAGGWKEITDKIHAGKFSWKALKGWRLCVPCFTNYGQKGTMDNANRLSIKEVIRCSPGDLKEGWCDNPPKSAGHANGHRDGMLSSHRRGAPDHAADSSQRPMKRVRRERSMEHYESVEVLADGDWWHAHVLEVAADGSSLVHYVGGTSDEDEWIPKGSPRIRSSQDAAQAPTPTPQSTPLVTPMKDRDISLPPCGALLEEPACLPLPPHTASPVQQCVLGGLGELDDDVFEEEERGAAGAVEEEEAEVLEHEHEAEDEDDEEEVEQELEAVVEVQERSTDANIVEVGIVVHGGGPMRFQWFEGREAIPGAHSPVLTLLNSGETGGPIACRLSNAFGTTWAFCPVLLPSSPEDAKAACTGFYRLLCRCGAEMEGSSSYLCETACAQCGAVCCGQTARLPRPQEEDDPLDVCV